RADVHAAPPRPDGGEARRPRAAMATQPPGSVHADGARSRAADLVRRIRRRRGESHRAEARRCGRGGSACGETAEATRPAAGEDAGAAHSPVAIPQGDRRGRGGAGDVAPEADAAGVGPALEICRARRPTPTNTAERGCAAAGERGAARHAPSFARTRGAAIRRAREADPTWGSLDRRRFPLGKSRAPLVGAPLAAQGAPRGRSVRVASAVNPRRSPRSGGPVLRRGGSPGRPPRRGWLAAGAFGGAGRGSMAP